jgi:hypothetical protein
LLAQNRAGSFEKHLELGWAATPSSGSRRVILVVGLEVPEVMVMVPGDSAINLRKGRPPTHFQVLSLLTSLPLHSLPRSIKDSQLNNNLFQQILLNKWLSLPNSMTSYPLAVPPLTNMVTTSLLVESTQSPPSPMPAATQCTPSYPQSLH